MKTLFLFALLLLTACSHPVHKPAPNREAMKPIEYCGGDMWGYIGPKGKDVKETAFVGVSYVGSDKKTLLFTYVLKLPSTGTVEFAKNEFQIKVNGKEMNQKPVEMAVHRNAYDPYHYYKQSQYTFKVVDYEKNQWEVRKIHPIFGHMQLGDPKIVTFPKNQVEVVKNGKFNFPENKDIENNMLITVIPLWPLNTPLADTEINVIIPAMMINHEKHPAQDYTFTFNLKDWLERAKSGKTRCPSIMELFRFNR